MNYARSQNTKQTLIKEKVIRTREHNAI